MLDNAAKKPTFIKRIFTSDEKCVYECVVETSCQRFHYDQASERNETDDELEAISSEDKHTLTSFERTVCELSASIAALLSV